MIGQSLYVEDGQMAGNFGIKGSWVFIHLLACCGVMAIPVAAEAAVYLGPQAVVAAADGKTLFVALADARQVAAVDVASGKVVRRTSLPAEPTSMTLAPGGKLLYVACAAAKSTVCAVEVASGKVNASLPAGHTASGLAVTPDGRRLYVCNRFNNDVSVIDVQARREIARLPAVREPIGAAITPDGKSLFVINLLPADRSDASEVAAEVTVIDTAGNRPATIRLLNGSSSVRGVCMSPDGKYVYITHILAHYQLPTTQLERGWMNTNALSIIDAVEKRLVNTVLLDNVDLGAANPWGVAASADGKWICVAHAGTHELSVIDAPGLLQKLAALAKSTGAEGRASPPSYGSGPPPSAADVPSDLAFLVGLRRRVPLSGHGPRGVALIGATAYVAEYFSDSLGVVDLLSLPEGPFRPAAQFALGPQPAPTTQRRGEMLFHDATICFQHWQSCASCHPDARADGFNWDLLNDGLGNPKNSKSMLLAHQTPPSMAEGARGGAEAAVRSGLTHILFAVRPEEEATAIDEYLKALRPVPSPYLIEGQLSPAAERGRQIFFDPAVGCAHCHPQPLYTDLQMHDVGSRAAFDRCDNFDTPTLIEVWRTAPYLHDGHYTTVKDLIVQGKHGNKKGHLDKLTPQEIDDLVEFVLSL